MELLLNRQIHALLTKAGLMEHKASLVASFSNERTESLREMTDKEGYDFVQYLNKQLPEKENWRNETEQKQEIADLDSSRKYIISLWYKIEGANSPEERKQAVITCKAWVQKHFKDDLNSFTAYRLFQIKEAAEKVLKDRAKAVRRAADGND